MARTGRAHSLFWASRFHHCASVPPVLRGGHVNAGRRTPQARGDRQPVVPDIRRDAGGREKWADDAFSGVQNNYWSSSTNETNPDNAWNVNLNNGNTNDDNKDNNNFVWPVRGGEWWSRRP